MQAVETGKCELKGVMQMTLKELYMASPHSFVFIRDADNHVREYFGGVEDKNEEVWEVKATSYPMYESVIEVRLMCDRRMILDAETRLF